MVGRIAPDSVLAAAYAARPERFVAGPPRASELPAQSGSTPHSPSAQLTAKIGRRMVGVTTERRVHYTESARCLKLVDRFQIEYPGDHPTEAIVFVVVAISGSVVKLGLPEELSSTESPAPSS